MASTAKTAIITGTSQGIGAGLAEAFRKRGYSVIANPRNITKANAFAASANVALVHGDIGDPSRSQRHGTVDTVLFSQPESSRHLLGCEGPRCLVS